MFVRKIGFSENRLPIKILSVRNRPNTLNYDTFEPSFGRKKKLDLDESNKKTEADNLCKSLKKFGVGENELKTLRQQSELVQKINDYEQNPFKKGLKRKITTYEAYNIVSHNYGDFAQRYLDLVDSNTEDKTPFTRTISKKEMPYFVRELKCNPKLIQRYMNFVDSSEECAISRGEIASILNEGYTDTQLEVYSDLRKFDLHKYNMESNPIDVIGFVKDASKCERFKQLQEKNRSLNTGDIFALIDGNFDYEQIKTYTKYLNSNSKNGKSSIFSRNIEPREAYFAIKNGLNLDKTQKLIDINDDWVSSEDMIHHDLCRINSNLAKYLNEENSDEKIELYHQLFNQHIPCCDIERVFNDKDLYTRFLDLNRDKNISCQKPLNIKHTLYVTINEFDDTRIEIFSSAMSEENPLYDWQVLSALSDDEIYKKFSKIKENVKKCDYKNINNGDIIFLATNNLSPEKEKVALNFLESGIDRDSALNLLKFLPYKGIKSTDELSLREKKDFIKTLINTSSFDLFNETCQKLGEDYKIVPKNQEEFSAVLSKIVKEINNNKKIDSDNLIKTLDLMANGEIETAEAIKTIQSMYNDVSDNAAYIADGIEENIKNLVSNPQFSQYSKEDKRTLLLADIFESISGENSQPTDNAFDTYYFLKSSTIDIDSQLKIYELIKSQNFIDNVISTYNSNTKTELKCEDIAFNLRRENTFEMAKLLYETRHFNKLPEVYDKVCNKIDKKLNVIRETQIFLPQPKIPKASEIKNVETKTSCGITNKVLYVNRANEDLSIYGFEKGSTKTNWKSLVHTFENEGQLGVFSTFGIIDSDALISSSYIGVDDYRTFRKQGVLIESDMEDIHAAYICDFGSGCKKNVNFIKRDYIFSRSEWRKYRNYVSNILKTELELNNDEYISLMDKIKDCKSYRDISKKDERLSLKLEKIFNNFASEYRRYNRKYNEVLVSRPVVKGVFAYDQSYEDIPLFLRKYAQDNDIPILIFGKA